MLTDILPIDTIHWLAGAWLAMLGAAVGSFLNVVVYRVPAGLSIAWPGSRCPLCLHAIRPYDNIPVLSWVLLRGHCRDCRAPISIRYPLVEAGTSALFIVLAVHELFRGAANLPGSIISTPAESGGVYGYHLLLLCTLLAAALVALDGRRPPLRLFLPTLTIGLLAPIAWPHLHPVHAWPGSLASPWAGWIDGIVGLAVGLVLGGLATRAARPRNQGDSPGQAPSATDLTWAAACVGSMLGWQAVGILVIGASALHQAARAITPVRLPIHRIPAAAWLAAGTLLWILAWAQLVPWMSAG